MKILSYNIQRGGRGREAAIAEVIRRAGADVIVLQEATHPRVVARIAEEAGLAHCASRPGRSLAVVSRVPLSVVEWHKPRLSRHAFLEIVPAGQACRIFGLHLSAVHSAWTERRRSFELKALLSSIAVHQHGFHLLIGDFNTLAPGERLENRLLPARLRALVWLSGGRVRWRTIQYVLDRGYVDAYRARHPDDPGPTFPTWAPHIRLDFAFIPERFRDRLRESAVVTSGGAAKASDHFPLIVEVASE